MQKKPPWLSLIIACLAATVAALASAAGLGAGGSGAVLGQPLDFVVQVRLEPGDTLTPECVSVEVMAGERRVLPSQVRTQVESQSPESARIRVVTLQGIDEPVIGINLSAGCTARITRRYVVLADPPATAAAAAPAFAASPAAVSATGLAAGSADVAPPVPDAATAAAGGAAGTEALTVALAASPRTPLSDAQRTAARAEPPAQRRSESRKERRAASRVAARAPRAEAAPRGRRAPAVATADAAAVRLRLDFVEPVTSMAAVTVEQAIEAVALAASATRAAASAASAADGRIAALERTVEQLRGEAKTSRDLATQFRDRLAQTEGSSLWMLPLMLLAVLLAALAAWLAWRLGRVQTERQQGWRAAAAPLRPAPEPTPSRQPTAPIPFVTSEIHSPAHALASTRARAAPAWPPPAPSDPWGDAPPTAPPDLRPEPATQRTEPMAPNARVDEGAPRDVSIEELIDLEQQAEFFVVLGQDDSAIDLLVEHLRSTGGGSPLPYLKLLEIYQRRDDRSAYERMRARFNHRFNAYAPEWGIDLSHGRALEDYTGVVPRLQQVWSRPLDAMAELEALLFRKSRGELFDLPAYREVLFLYSLARDLLDREAADTGDVDLLLPLADLSEFSTTSPSPFMGLERDALGDAADLDDRPTMPVDFDLSAAEKPTSIFDQLAEPPPQRRR